MIACPYCAFELAGRGFCLNCTLAVDVDARGHGVARLPTIERGAALDHWDFSRDPMPALDARAGADETPTADGIRVALTGGTYFSPAPSSRLRDGCATLDATVASGAGYAGVALRTELVDEARTTYLFWVCPEKRVAKLLRAFLTQGSRRGTAAEVVAEHELPRSAVAVGRRMRVELRARGATLQGLVDGVTAVHAHDPHLGDGYPMLALQFAGGSAPSAVVCHALTLHEVKP